MSRPSLKFLRRALILVIAVVIPLAMLSAQGAKKKPVAKGSATEGEAVFKKNCAMCHFPDKPGKKIGPGMKGLFKLKELPQARKAATEANIRAQIQKGSKAMPGFANKLPAVELDNLIAYLRTL